LTSDSSGPSDFRGPIDFSDPSGPNVT